MLESTGEEENRLESLFRADEYLYRHLRLDQVLQGLADAVVEILHADKTSVQVWDPAQQRLVVLAQRGYSPEMVAYMSAYKPGDGIAGNVFLSGEPMAVDDARLAPPPANWIAEREEIRSVLSVPIKIDGTIFGVFGMNYRVQRTFSSEDKRVFAAFAQHAAIAIQNARLFEQAEQAAILQERQRLARDLHDSISQSLYSLVLMAEAGRRFAAAGDLSHIDRHLQRLGEVAEQALKEMRLMVYELRPLALESHDLASALRQRLDAVEKRAGLQAELLLSGVPHLAAEVEHELYWIAREALNNSLKHSSATRVTVRLAAEPGGLELSVADNGSGFELSTGTGAGGMGLASMRDRAAKIKAVLSVHSQPGQGCSVTVRLTGTRMNGEME